MEYVYPDYYEQFTCIADRCEDTCCAGWQIMIDDESMKKYKKIPGSFGNRLKNCIRWEEQCFEQCDRRCAFLNDENLCDIYCELGEDSLCRTCKTYPKHMEEFENLREVSLSLSCPEACRLILRQQDRLTFVSEEKEDVPEEEFEDFDFLFFTKLTDIREYLLHLIQDEAIDFYDRLAISLAFAHDSQRRICQNKIFEIDDLIEAYSTQKAIRSLSQKCKNYQFTHAEYIEWLHELKRMFQTLEPLNEEWFAEMDRAFEAIWVFQETEYKRLYRMFKADCGHVEHDLEQIAKTLLYTYVCGAVYDDDLFSKVKFAFISCCMIEILDFACWIRHEQQFSMEDQVKITHQYSREIEHSDQNLENLERFLKTQPQFHIKQLLSALYMK